MHERTERMTTATTALRLVVSRPEPLIRRDRLRRPVRRVAPYEVVVDGIKVYQSENGRNGWVCLVFTDDSHQLLWWTQHLEDFAPAEQELVAKMIKAKYGIDIDPL